MKKQIILNLEDIDTIVDVGKALSSKIRIQILKFLIRKSANITEIANQFNIPLSSAALHIKILEEAKMVLSQSVPGLRGSQKLCGIAFEQIKFDLSENLKRYDNSKYFKQEMPIGNFFDCSVIAPCGIVSEETYIAPEDYPYGFFCEQRLKAQLIWFTQGFLCYKFSNQLIKEAKAEEISFSFEICSEAVGYNNNWRSDVSIWINEIEIGIVKCLGDYGDVRGNLNPDWWADTLTQYGKLHTVLINNEGVYIDGNQVSNYNIATLKLVEGCCIDFRIGVKEDAEFLGGLNLFGERFGNHNQNIVMIIKATK